MNLRPSFAFLSLIVTVLTLSLTAHEEGNAENGKKTFEQCAVCHNTDTDEKKVGPSLKGVFKRKKLQNGKPVTDENVLTQINAGGGGMPPFGDKLSAEEKGDLIAYLHTL